MMKKSETTLKTNKINNNAKSFLAKLLATENISVEHKKVKTAYFDVKSRLLVLPIWKDMNEDITDLLIAHEVGHALFTPQDGWEDAVIERKIPKSFCNVIEDARIEKLIKRRYPGLSQSFIKGYRDLINNDFFGTKDKDLNNMLLIDRLNIHFKSSHVESPLTFTDSYEKDVVSRMEKLETFEDVIELADELSKYCKEEQEEKEQEMQTNGFDEHGFDDEDFGLNDADNDDLDDQDDEDEEENSASKSDDDKDDDGDIKDEEEEKSDEPSAGIQSEQELNGLPSKPVTLPEEVSAETDQSWEDKKENLLDPASKNNEYINIHNYKNVNDYIIDYKTVLKDFDKALRKPYQEETESKFGQKSISKMISKYRQFNKDQSKKVSYMVKEYEMKKAASAYSRTKQDKSGIIDPLKLHSYKYNDDIFKRMSITPDGKNHGMMMFIDWSGSMADKMTPTIHQLMNLTMFCQKVNIPFEVYAFSNDNGNRRWDKNALHETPKDKSRPKYEEGDVTVDERLKLLNFVSSRMNAKEYEKGMINLFLLSERYDNTLWYMSRKQYNSLDSDEYDKYLAKRNYLDNLPSEPYGYGLCSTPLNDCIMASMPMVNAFRKKYAIDKMNTIFLTDGASDGNDRYVMLNPSKDEITRRYLTKQPGGYYVTGTEYDNNIVLRDTKTKKEYNLERTRDMTDQLLDALRERTGTKVLGFYISSGKKIDRWTLNKYFPDYAYEKKEKVFDRKKVMAEFRKNKCLVVKDNTAYDEFYLLAGGELQISDGQMATPSENAKKSEIKRLFTSTLKQNKDSRVVLNKFISQVA